MSSQAETQICPIFLTTLHRSPAKQHSGSEIQQKKLSEVSIKRYGTCKGPANSSQQACQLNKSMGYIKTWDLS